MKILLAASPESAAPSAGILLLRVVFGMTLLVQHGMGTLHGFLRDSSSYPDPIGIGPQMSMALMLFAELICTALVAIGIFCRLSAAPLVIGFSVAAFIQHYGDPLRDRELALLYLAAFAAILLTGPGRYSLDYLLLRTRRVVPVLIALTALPLAADARQELQQGVDAVLRAKNALGAMPKVVLIGEGMIDPAAQLQGFRPDSTNPVPFREELVLTADGRTGYESRYTRHDGTEEWLRFAYHGDEMQFVQMTEGFAARAIDPDFEDAAARLRRMLPHELVAAALRNRSSIRHLGRVQNADRVAFALPTGELITMEIDRAGLVRGFDYVVDVPLLGDTVVRWDYGSYEDRIPGGYTIAVGGRTFKRVAWKRSAADSAVFSIPEGVEAPPPPQPSPSTPAPPRVVERAPGIWQVQRLRSGFHPMFMEFQDFVVAFEAPTGWLELHEVPASDFVSGATSNSVSQTFIRLIHETVPGKPIRYLVLSHFHGDHSGGVAPFIAAGATIVTTAPGRYVVERAHPEARFEIVNGRHAISDGTRRVELIEVDNKHVDGMLVSWVPSVKLLFVSDLFLPLGKTFPSQSELPMNLDFVEWLDRSGLEPEILLAIHGASRGNAEQLEILRTLAAERALQRPQPNGRRRADPAGHPPVSGVGIRAVPDAREQARHRTAGR